MFTQNRSVVYVCSQISVKNAGESVVKKDSKIIKNMHIIILFSDYK